MVNTTINYQNSEVFFRGMFENDHIYKHLKITKSFYELKLLEKVKSLNLYGTYVDVGANIGNHTIFFSKFCNSEKIISFELDTKIYNTLSDNIVLNNLTNIEINNYGIAEKTKNVSISEIDETNVGMTKIVNDGGDHVVRSLDEVLDIEKNITLIKIDVEGYEKNVILGGKHIIKKHQPVIISELRDADEFNDFSKIMDELDYYTDKINYASTPTYFWYKKEKIYDFIYIIPTYDRYEKLTKLMDNILENSKNTLIIVLNDGSTDVRYKSLKNKQSVIYLENEFNFGIQNYWRTVNILLDRMSNFKFKNGVMISDDFDLTPDYQKKLNSSLDDRNIIRLFTQTSVGKTNWGYKDWIDGAFCAPYSFFERINFELFPILNRRNMVSSGVGYQMTKRLNNLKYKVFDLGTIITHNGNNDSKMHPKVRPIQPLTNMSFNGVNNIKPKHNTVNPVTKEPILPKQNPPHEPVKITKTLERTQKQINYEKVNQIFNHHQTKQHNTIRPTQSNTQPNKKSNSTTASKMFSKKKLR